jgi:thioredoxin reductase (NADPH)
MMPRARSRAFCIGKSEGKPLLFPEQGSAMRVYDVIVIGSGIAGLTTTRHLLHLNRSLAVLNIEADSFGGLVMNINELDGTVHGSGIEYAAGLVTEATDLGASIVSERVIGLAKESDCWSVLTAEEKRAARAVVIASGATLKKLGIPGENEFEYKGVSHCADCDGPMFTDKVVAVAGGGDSALQEARVLASFCRHVYVLNQGVKFTARKALVDALAPCKNVTVLHGTKVSAIVGNQKVHAIRTTSGQNSEEIACDGVFGYIGLKPANDFVDLSYPRDANGCLITDPSFRIADGLFAIGAVRSGYGGMLEHAIAEGQNAAEQIANDFNARLGKLNDV